MRILMPLFFALFLTGCAAKRPSQAETYGAQIGIVNHTGNFIYSASVNGQSGGGMARWGAGNAGVCCVILPLAYQPGFQVKLKWDMPDGSKHNYQERVVDLEVYEEGNSVYLHFFPDGSVRAVVTPYLPVSPKHPIEYHGKPK